jgi:hypothetical protein
MKKLLIIAVIVISSVAQAALASNVGVDIHIGNQPQVVPAPPPPPVVIEEPPLFLYPAELGFGVAVGVPYDVFFISGSYYLNQGDVWYRGHNYNGPWVVARYKALPPGLRRHKFERIHYYRDREYHAYQAKHDRYLGKHYRPEKRMKEEMKEQRKEDKQRWKEEKKWEKEERKHDKGQGKHGGRD